MMKKNISLAGGIGLVALIPLLLLLLAIWNWRPATFVLAFIILVAGANLTHEMITRKLLTNKTYRIAIIVAVTTALVLCWMNAAVGGILGDNPANMMYFGVLIVGLCGGFIARLEPIGMSRTLFAAGFATMLIPTIALIIGTPAFANGVTMVFGLHAIFATLFIVSAMLFLRAARANFT